MEPATLYILFQLAGGPQKALERGFVSVQDCHEFVRHVLHPQADKARILRYECVALAKMQSAPVWYKHYAQQRLIQGVPLDPRNMR